MKIDEKMINYVLMLWITNELGNTTILLNGLKRNVFNFLINFSPFGQAGGSHLLRYSGFEVEELRLHPESLVDGSLRLVQNPGSHLSTSSFSP